MANRVTVNIPDEKLGAILDFKVEKTVELPSGRIATFRKGLGRDMMRAQKILQAMDDEMTNPFALSCALASVLGRIDDKPFTYFEIMEMDIPEASALAGAASENFSSRGRETSPPSSASGSNAVN
jgi:hypothetical protein